MEDDLKLVWKPGRVRDTVVPGTMQCTKGILGPVVAFVRKLERRDAGNRHVHHSSRSEPSSPCRVD
jgi:hypothetical protein